MKKNLIKSGTGNCMFVFTDSTNTTAKEIANITNKNGRKSIIIQMLSVQRITIKLN